MGNCGGMWGKVGWQGAISDCGMGAMGGVGTAGCANFHKF